MATAHPWTIRNQTQTSAEILIYEEIGSNWWTNDGLTAKAFSEDLKKCGNVRDLTVRLNSPGGNVFDGIAIYNQLKSHPAQVTVHIDGLAASIASVIAMAGDLIVMPSNALMMIHDPYGTVQGTAEDMRKQAEVLDLVKTSIMAAYRTRTGMSDDEISALMSAETWMDGSEAKERGFCDEVTEVVEITNKFDLSRFNRAPIRPAASAVEAIPTVQEEHMEKVEVTPAADLQAERQRIDTIMRLGDQHNCLDLARNAIKDGLPVEHFQHTILNTVYSAKPAPIIDASLGLSEKESKQYRIMNVIAAMATGDWTRAGFERECSDSLAKKLGKTPRGVYMPSDIRNVMTKGTASAGGDLVATDLLAASFIELLRNKLVIKQAGAQVLSGLVGDVAIPKMTAGATAYWVTENTAITSASQPTLGQVTMTPKTVGAYTDMSRKLLLQSSLSVEAMVRDDLARTIATAVDYVAINGAAASDQPVGILNTSGIGAVSGGSDGLAPAWSHIVGLETEIAVDNADMGSLAYLTNPKVRGKLKSTMRTATYGDIPIWAGGAQPLNDYPVYITNQVPSTLTKGGSGAVCSAIIFGNFNDLIIGEWGALDILVDPYTGGTAGTLRVIVHQDMDVCVRHAESFAAMKDALTT